MKVLVIGATGYVGARVARKLKDKGFVVHGLARSESSRAKIEAAGYVPVEGDLLKRDTLRAAVTQMDAVIHAGLPGDSINDGVPAFDQDHLAIETMLSEMKGQNKTFIYSTGALTVADERTIGKVGEPIPENECARKPMPMVAQRAATENMVLDAAELGIRTVVVRIPHVYGDGGNFVLPYLIDAAEREGCGVYIGEGQNTISLVHVEDLADLYVLALEKSPAGRLYQPASFDMRMGEIAARVSQEMGLGGRTASIPFEKAKEAWGLGPALVVGLNSQLGADDANRVLGWAPKNMSLDAEIAYMVDKARRRGDDALAAQ